MYILPRSITLLIARSADGSKFLRDFALHDYSISEVGDRFHAIKRSSQASAIQIILDLLGLVGISLECADNLASIWF